MANVATAMTATDLRSCVENMLNDYGYGTSDTTDPLSHSTAVMLASFIEPMLAQPADPNHLRELIFEAEFFLRVPFMLGDVGYETWDDIEAAWSKTEADVAFMADRIINPRRVMASSGTP